MKSKLTLRDFSSASDRRKFLEEKLGIKLDNIGSFTFPEDQTVGRNIENLIGAIQVPLGIAGPLTLKTINDKRYTIYIPLATTEGALVASISRGCKAITESGGAVVEVETVGITRGPVFKTTGLKHGLKVKNWINTHTPLISLTAQKTSNHLKLLKVETALVGKNLFARFYYDTQDAMGMNMATIATEKAVQLIEKKTKAKCISLAGNFDIDKKPAWLNFISGRGKKVWAEVTLPKKVVKEVLKTTSERIADVVYRKTMLGSAMSGSLGFNSHFANIIAAIFIATGQDPAHVVEASLGITDAEVEKNGDLYFSIFMPAIQIGTIGGGTHLPTQQEAFKIMGLSDGKVIEFAIVIGAAVLAGELSLIASLAEESLARAHIKLARKRKERNHKYKSKPTL